MKNPKEEVRGLLGLTQKDEKIGQSYKRYYPKHRVMTIVDARDEIAMYGETNEDMEVIGRWTNDMDIINEELNQDIHELRGKVKALEGECNSKTEKVRYVDLFDKNHQVSKEHCRRLKRKYFARIPVLSILRDQRSVTTDGRFRKNPQPDQRNLTLVNSL